MKQYLILLAASILFFIVGYLTNDVINDKIIQNIINDKIIRDSLETFFIRDQSCYALFKECPYFKLAWKKGVRNVPYIDVQLVKDAYENCVKPLRAYRESNHENFRICYEKDISFRLNIDRMEEEILAELNSLRERLPKPKPQAKPKPSFLEGKSAEEIFEMYHTFAKKYDLKNKTHQTELKKWADDPLFLVLKNDGK